ncbi:MAG: hypothetical protein Q8P84_01745 [Deltaproteobacteria bacterium]|nr:hypothetical protein [Deltaproteobacteria bacterium]
MFDIQLPLSIFSPGSFGVAPLTALDMEVVAATGSTDLTDPVQCRQMLAQLQTGWLTSTPQNRFSFAAPFVQTTQYLFANGAGFSEQKNLTTGTSIGAYNMGPVLAAVAQAIHQIQANMKTRPELLFLSETLENVQKKVVKGDRLEARFLIELAVIMYNDTDVLNPLRSDLTVDWANTNPLHCLAKIGRLLEALHEKTRGEALSLVENIQGVNARISALLQLEKTELAQKEWDDFLEQHLAALHQMPPHWNGILYFLEGAQQSIGVMRSSPDGMIRLIHRCIDIMQRDFPTNRAEADILVLRGLLSQIDQGKRDNAVNAVRRLIQRSKAEQAGTLQEFLEILLNKLRGVSQ